LTFSRIQPTGWATNQKLLSTEMNQLDLDHSRALDGNAGGTFAPSSALVINGSGLQVGGSGFSCNTFASTGNCTLGNDVADVHQWNGTLATTNGTLSVAGTGTVALSGTTLLSIAGTCSVDVDCDMQVNTCTFGGAVVCNSSITVTGTLNGNGDCNIGNGSGDTHSLTGTLTVGGSSIIGFASSGRIRYRTSSVSSDADASITPQTADVYFIPDGVLSVNRNFTIDDTSCANGDELRVVCEEATGGVAAVVRIPGPTTVATISRNAATSPFAVKLMRIGGTWRVIELSFQGIGS